MSLAADIDWLRAACRAGLVSWEVIIVLWPVLDRLEELERGCGVSVSVSLEKLVAVPHSRPAWPERFAELVAGLEESPGEASAWLVLADWLQEHDEPGMERACRWVAKRVDTLRPTNARMIHQPVNPYWRFNGAVPTAVAAVMPQDADRRTVAGLIADAAAALRRLEEEGAA